MHKRVIRGKIISERWMERNGLEKMMELIRMQKWEKIFAKRDLVFKTECREFYKNLKVSVTWKKEVAKSMVNGVEIEFDGMTLATILEIPGNSGLCDYIKEEWEPARYSNPLKITRKVGNDDTILEARWVKRRDDEEVAPAENEEVHEEEQNPEFDWEAEIDEAALQGESGSGEKFYDAEDEIQESEAVVKEVQEMVAHALAQ
ncbi:hypothetical protein Dimus_013795 [Dionaea muscipula]